ncbi:MAG: hypothetical protein WC120_03700 [Parcubacteria group bacterium]
MKKNRYLKIIFAAIFGFLLFPPLVMAQGQGVTIDQADAMLGQGGAMLKAGNCQAAKQLLSQAVSVYTGVNTPENRQKYARLIDQRIARGYVTLAKAEQCLGNNSQAISIAQSILPLGRALDDRYVIGNAEMILATSNNIQPSQPPPGTYVQPNSPFGGYPPAGQYIPPAGQNLPQGQYGYPPSTGQAPQVGQGYPPAEQNPQNGGSKTACYQECSRQYPKEDIGSTGDFIECLEDCNNPLYQTIK